MKNSQISSETFRAPQTQMKFAKLTEHTVLLQQTTV